MTPPDAQSAVPALIQSMERRIAALGARLGQNSSNSSKPPSSDSPHVKRRPPRPPSGKARGGQRGHKRHTRELVAPERLSAVVDCKPAVCRRCGHDLKGVDPGPIRHQVAELAEARPEVIEYRLHRLVRGFCGVKTQGGPAAGVPRGALGTRLQATVALLGGAYRLSERQMRSVLAEGAACGCTWTAKVCRKLLSAEVHLWTFAAAGAVPPRSNAAERALRHGVIWRKTNYGTDAEAGSRCVERMLTAVASCRQRGRDVLGFLTAYLRSRLDGTPTPSLLA